LLLLPADILGTYIEKLPVFADYSGTDPTVRNIFVTYSVNIVINVLTALICFRFLRLLGFSVRESVAGVLALLFCTTHLHYTQNMMENNFIFLLTLTGFSFQYEWLRRGSARALLAGSAAFGFNLLIRLTTGLDLIAYGGGTFSSLNPNVVTINSNGVVRAVAPGTGKVVVNYGGLSATNTLTVVSLPPVLTHRYSFTTDASDSVGGANGTLMGAATVSGGKLVLDGSFGTYVDLPASEINIATNTAVTFETWVTFGDAQTWGYLFGFGNSIGGWMAAEMALLDTSRISSFVLVDAVGIEVPGHPIADFFSLSPRQVAEISYHDPDRFGMDPSKLSPEALKGMASNRATLAVYAGTSMNDAGLADRLAAVDDVTAAKHLDFHAFARTAGFDELVDQLFHRVVSVAGGHHLGAPFPILVFREHEMIHSPEPGHRVANAR